MQLDAHLINKNFFSFHPFELKPELSFALTVRVIILTPDLLSDMFDLGSKMNNCISAVINYCRARKN